LRTRRRLVVAVAVALASAAIPCAAQKKAPVPAASDPAVKGAVVSYQEMKQSAIVYLEERGGMTVRSTTPVTAEPDGAAKAERAESKSAEERATSTGTGTSTSARRVPQRREAGLAK
jgi:hypothetical protein